MTMVMDFLIPSNNCRIIASISISNDHVSLFYIRILNTLTQALSCYVIVIITWKQTYNQTTEFPTKNGYSSPPPMKRPARDIDNLVVGDRYSHLESQDGYHY